MGQGLTRDPPGRGVVVHHEVPVVRQGGPRRVACVRRPELPTGLHFENEVEVALYQRLRTLFEFDADLVLYDLTSTYFEGHGPPDMAKHGHSRDGKPRKLQVVVGVVMVAGWPIAHHVWAGNRRDSTTVQEVVKDLSERFHFGRLVFVGDRGRPWDGDEKESARTHGQ